MWLTALVLSCLTSPLCNWCPQMCSKHIVTQWQGLMQITCMRCKCSWESWALGQTSWCVWQHRSNSSHSQRSMRALVLHSGGKGSLCQRNSNPCRCRPQHRKYQYCRCHCSQHNRKLRRMRLRPLCRGSRAWCKDGSKVLCRGWCSRGRVWTRVPCRMASM